MRSGGSEEPLRDHIIAGQHRETKLWHGMFYRNCPTPSGCDRPILKLSTTEGYSTEKEAVEVMKSAFTPEKLAEIDVPNFDA
jgi:hypothetical protein